MASSSWSSRPVAGMVVQPRDGGLEGGHACHRAPPARRRSAAARIDLPTPVSGTGDEERRARTQARRASAGAGLARRSAAGPAAVEAPGIDRGSASVRAPPRGARCGGVRRHRRPAAAGRCRRERSAGGSPERRAVAERALARCDGVARRADHDRQDVRLARSRRRQPPRRRAHSAAPARCAASCSTRCGCSRTISSAACAAATAGGGSAVEKISVRAVLTRYRAVARSQHA